MGGLKKTYKGSTLIEVIVAMIIIFICMGSALVLFTNLSRDVNDDLRIAAILNIDEFAMDSKIDHNFSNLTKEFGNMHIQRTLLEYPKNKQLKILYIEAFTLSGKKITEYKEIILLQ